MEIPIIKRSSTISGPWVSGLHRNEEASWAWSSIAIFLLTVTQCVQLPIDLTTLTMTKNVPLNSFFLKFLLIVYFLSAVEKITKIFRISLRIILPLYTILIISYKLTFFSLLFLDTILVFLFKKQTCLLLHFLKQVFCANDNTSLIFSLAQSDSIYHQWTLSHVLNIYF